MNNRTIRVPLRLINSITPGIIQSAGRLWRARNSQICSSLHRANIVLRNKSNCVCVCVSTVANCYSLIGFTRRKGWLSGVGAHLKEAEERRRKRETHFSIKAQHMWICIVIKTIHTHTHTHTHTHIYIYLFIYIDIDIAGGISYWQAGRWRERGCVLSWIIDIL